jgi:hypothetical protein
MVNNQLENIIDMEYKIIKIQMPINLLLMTQYFDFNFFEIPKSYMNL